MHQAVTDLGKARDALEKAHLARHQLHASWRQFLGQALTTWQSYTDGFKQQEADLVARIDEAKQCLNGAKETFEECRNALSEMTQTDLKLIEEGAEAMAVDAEGKEVGVVTRLQQDFELMQNHLATLKNNADALMEEDKNASVKRPRLEAVPPAVEPLAAPPGSTALQPFGGAHK